MNKLRTEKNISLIVLTCIFLSTLTGCTSCTTSSNVNELDEYLQKNYSSVDLDDENYIKDFGISDKDLKKYDVFLAGEIHGTKKNYDLQFELIKYLNQNAGVRYILSEGGYGSNQLINQFLETGDKKVLENLFKYRKGLISWNKESYEFYEKIREYNQQLNDDQKIKLIGIDIEHQITPALMYLKSILPKDDVPAEIETTISTFKNKEYANVKTWDDYYDYIDFLNSMQEDIRENEKIYKEYLEESYFDFSIVLDNIINSQNAYDSECENEDEFWRIRENSMYDNFKRVYEHFPKGKYFGQFGAGHVFQNNDKSELYNTGRLGMYLNEDDSPVKNKVLSINYEYINCYHLVPNYDIGIEYDGYADVPMPISRDMDVVEKYTKTDFTIIKLNGKRSPFGEKIYFLDPCNDGVTTDYFQYMVLIKDSKAVIPFN